MFYERALETPVIVALLATKGDDKAAPSLEYGYSRADRGLHYRKL